MRQFRLQRSKRSKFSKKMAGIMFRRIGQMFRGIYKYTLHKGNRPKHKQQQFIYPGISFWTFTLGCVIIKSGFDFFQKCNLVLSGLNPSKNVFSYKQALSSARSSSLFRIFWGDDLCWVEPFPVNRTTKFLKMSLEVKLLWK